LKPGQATLGDMIVEPAIGAVDGDGRVHARRHKQSTESAGKRLASVPALLEGMR
jgi:hypothetical protein